jgi:hypothetical protein
LHAGSLTARRAQALGERLVAIRTVAARDDLTANERSVLNAAIETHRSRAALARAQEAVATGSRDVRRRCLEAALTSRSFAQRARLIAATVVPKGMRRRFLGVDGSDSLLVRPAVANHDR